MDHLLLSQIWRLTAAALLGGVVGFQRERDRHPAGLRTHMLVAVGSALITLVSDSYPGSDGRIAAQIVSGIGFLGAGTIIREGPNVKGLTTAASLWAVAGLGLAAGRGGTMLLLGAVATVIILLTLSAVDALERRVIRRKGRRALVASVEEGATGRLFEALVESHVTITDARAGEADTTGAHPLVIQLSVPFGVRPEDILSKALHVDGVRHVWWDEDQQEVDWDV